MRLPLPLLGAAVVVVAASGCGGGNSGSSGQTKATPTSNASSGGSAVKTVTISETEYKLTPSSVKLSKPGTYVFKAVNKGTVTHALEIEGNGVEQKSSDIEPGKSATVKVDLKKTGGYEMYCPIDGHKNQGMKGQITIGSSAGSGGMTTEQTTTSQTRTGYGY